MVNVFLFVVALAGHAFLLVGVVNRLHAFPVRRRTIKYVTWLFFALGAIVTVGIGWRILGGVSTETPWRWGEDGTLAGILADGYIAVCLLIAPITILRLIGLCILHRRPSIVRFHQRRRVAIDLLAVAQSPEELNHHVLTQLPFNEMLQLEISRWIIDAPRLPPALDGLTIAHLSDLHFTEHIGKAYFREIVRKCNELQPDLVCVTGDIVDCEACLNWIPDTLGRLQSRFGVYFVLGNHDLYVDTQKLRALLEQNGLTDLGGHWRRVEIRGEAVALGGNERPWFASDAIDQMPLPDAFRIALAHTPDQYDWARRNDVDLMLAGHTHGGQIRIPPFGAIFTPTIAGVRYISGLYFVQPTILHISRGLSGDIPVRWNCRPEITLLKLHCGEKRFTSCK